MKKQLFILVCLIIVCGVGGYLLAARGNDAATVNANIKDGLLLAETLNVSFQSVGGRVKEVLVREGDAVAEGDVLVILDDTDLTLQQEQLRVQQTVLEAQIAAARSQIGDYDKTLQGYAVETAELNLSNALKAHDRVAVLFEAGAVSSSNLDEAALKLRQAEIALGQSRETLGKAQSAYNAAVLGVEVLEEQKSALAVQQTSLELQLGRLELKTPASGTVMSVIPKQGENVSPNSPMVVLQRGNLYFDIYVPETSVQRFQDAESVPVYVAAMNQTLNGEIRFVLSAPQYASARTTRDGAESDLSSFQVRIVLESAEGLLPGMTAEVRLDESTF
jgi:HlyD family secretion protein